MMSLVYSLVALTLAADPAPAAGKYFKIQVVDEQTQRGVPLVELTTTSHVKYYTDSNGIVAYYEPGLMNQTVFFHVKSHGYECAKDGFGYRGVRLKVTEGSNATIRIKRNNIAERLYRVTGGGIYRDSVLVGEKVPVKEPLLNGQVLGSDSVVNSIYHGKLHWFWGDTSRPSYPLGNFNVPGAVSELPAQGGLDPEVGVNLQYFVDKDGFAKETARMPGQGPTWIWGLVNLTDKRGKERLFAGYVKIRPPMETYNRGIVEFNDEKKAFEKVAEIDLKAPVFPGAHPFKHTENGVEYVYFPLPFPFLRVRADVEAIKDITQYEAYTPLKEGTRLSDAQIERTEEGRLRYAWKKNTPLVNANDEGKLIAKGLLKKDEALTHLQDAETGKPIQPHTSSVYWNEYKKRWIMISGQTFGTPSFLGEIWYAEAEAPVGPWSPARRVVTHDKMSLYNPKQHPYFAKEGGRFIFFEGTYTNSFSAAQEQTPYYEYNQIMYKLDMADPRLQPLTAGK